MVAGLLLLETQLQNVDIDDCYNVEHISEGANMPKLSRRIPDHFVKKKNHDELFIDISPVPQRGTFRSLA